MRSISSPVVHLVTDRRRVSPDARTAAAEIAALERVIDEAIGAGVDGIQIRERDLEAASLTTLVLRACRAASGTATLVLVNDRVDVALVAGAHGVHLPSYGLDVTRARAILGERAIGRSVHSQDAAGIAAGADYVFFGTVFETRSKPGQSDVAGCDGLRAAVQAFSMPVLAIGGVTPERASECVHAGAAGIAAIAPFLPAGREPGALGAARAVAEFRAAMVRAR